MSTTSIAPIELVTPYRCTCGQPAYEHTGWAGPRLVACRRCAAMIGARDHVILPELADRLNRRKPGRLRHSTAKAWHSLRPKRKVWRRELRTIAYRWLRRFVGGAWHLGGHHVCRWGGGPMVAETTKGHWYVDLS